MKKILILITAFLFSLNLFAQADTSELAKKTLVQANEAYEQEDYDSAYKKINMALSFTPDLDKAPNVVIIARTIYKKVLEKVLEEQDTVRLLEIENDLQKYPKIVNSDLELLIKQINTKSVVETEKINIELVEKNNRTMQKLIATVIIFFTLMLCVIVAIIIIIRLALKKQHRQQEMYIAAIQNLAENQNKANQLLIGGMTDLYGSMPLLQLGGQEVWKPAMGIPEYTFSEEDQEMLKELAIKCEDIGSQVDQITHRKNNSKNVSELVYKLSIGLGLSKGMALLNFCASMVYDAGFLGIDPELLTAPSLNDEQKEILRNHVMLAQNYLDFVPKKYWSVFEDAVKKHHENIDGSGYPKGLEGEAIPQIARLIRVAESYVSLSSKRDYREPLDKESAVEVLRSQPQYYDKAVVEALDRIV